MDRRTPSPLKWGCIPSKAALNMLVMLEARDYGLEGLKVFTFSPGFVQSNPRGASEEARFGGWPFAS